MQTYNGKYRKQPHKRKYIMTGIVGTVLVLSLFAIVFYKLGERSARESQEPVSGTAALMQETYTEPPSTTETTAIVTTEATTAPIETTTAPLVQTQPTVAPTVAPTVPLTQTGTVLHSVDVLNVRSGAGTNYGIIRRLQGGETVTIYEQQYADGMTWGNVGYGWVSMNYIVFGTDSSQAQDTSVQNSQAQTGTVLRSTDLLNVRSGAGMNYGIIRRLQGGETVTVYEQQYSDGMTWGNIGYGWVSMDYIVFGRDPSQEPVYSSESPFYSIDPIFGICRADYVGEWIDSELRCYLQITQSGNDVMIYVEYPYGAPVKTTWQMFGQFNEHLAIEYSNGVSRENSNGFESVRYYDGNGTMILRDGAISWHEAREKAGDFKTFTRIGAHTVLPNNSYGSNSNTQTSPSKGNTESVQIPKRFDTDDIRVALTKEAKIQLGYRYGDEFSISYPCLTKFNSSTGEYRTFIQGKWNGAQYSFWAVLQDVNGVLVVTKVTSFNIR